MTTYQYWAHQSGDLYAVRVEDDKLTGIVGPIHQDEVISESLPDWNYDDYPEDVPWARERENEFRLHEPD